MNPRDPWPTRVLALLLTIAAVPAAAAGSGEGDFDFTLAPGAMEEICFKLAAQEAVQWRYTADAPADFNLHWHEGKAVHMPVQREAAREDAGRFVAERAEDYCLMWTARAAPVRIRGRMDRGR
jgi:hypothetical protein